MNNWLGMTPYGPAIDTGQSPIMIIVALRVSVLTFRRVGVARTMTAMRGMKNRNEVFMMNR
jgi:hypothetical protein